MPRVVGSAPSITSEIRIMPASAGCASTVFARTYRSYCEVTHSLEARFGDPSSSSSVARRSLGRSRRSAESAFSAG